MSYVLVVDDDPDAREVLGEYLRRVGYDAYCVPGGNEAIHSVIDRRPDAVVLDLYMPRMDGRDFLQVVRSYVGLQHLPVVVWTAFPDSPLVKHVQAMGVTRVLIKGKDPLNEIDAALQWAMGPMGGGPAAGGERFHFPGPR
jgi:CheY-like chemotaxis protein